MSLNIPLNYSSSSDIVYTKDFHRYEYCFFSEFSDYFNSADFDKNFSGFISNLPYESIKIAEKIVERIQKISSKSVFENMDLFSDVEKQNIFYNYSKNCLRRYKNASEYGGIVFPSFIEFELWTCLYKSGFVFFENKNFQNSFIFDVGGYVGDSSLFIQKYTKANVFTFEPDSYNFKIMKIILQANNNDKITPFNLAFGDMRKKNKFYSKGIMSSFYSNEIKENNISEINVETVDNFSENYKIIPNVIKIDVEGAEFLVLSGAKEIIRKHKPLLIVSVYHNPEEFFGLKKQIEELDSGYKFKLVKPDDGLILRKTTLLAYVD